MGLAYLPVFWYGMLVVLALERVGFQRDVGLVHISRYEVVDGFFFELLFF